MSKRRTSEPVLGSVDIALNQAVDTLTLQDHLELVKPLYNRLGLDTYLEYFIEHGQSSRARTDHSLAYHDTTHSYQVALNCYEGGLYSGISNKELRVLMVAGLFHDANHTRGKHGDAVNIDNALRCMDAANRMAPEHQRLKPEEFLEARELIKYTEYPYKAKKISSTLGRILRDADMMALYTTDADTLLELFLGLINETMTIWHFTRVGERFQGTQASIDEFWQKQRRFISMMEWNTSWGKIKAFKRNWPYAGRRLQLLLEHAKKSL